MPDVKLDCRSKIPSRRGTLGIAMFSGTNRPVYISGPHLDHRFVALWRHCLDLGLKWRLEARKLMSPIAHSLLY